MESNLSISYEMKHTSATELRHTTPSNLPERMKTKCPWEDLYKGIFTTTSFIKYKNWKRPQSPWVNSCDLFISWNSAQQLERIYWLSTTRGWISKALCWMRNCHFKAASNFVRGKNEHLERHLGQVGPSFWVKNGAIRLGICQAETILQRGGLRDLLCGQWEQERRDGGPVHRFLTFPSQIRSRLRCACKMLLLLLGNVMKQLVC